MDEYRSDKFLEHFQSRSEGLNSKKPITQGPNTRFYVQYDQPEGSGIEQLTSDKFTYMGTSIKQSQGNMINMRKINQDNMRKSRYDQ